MSKNDVAIVSIDWNGDGSNLVDGYVCLCGKQNSYHSQTYSGGVHFCGACSRYYEPHKQVGCTTVLRWTGKWRCDHHHHEIDYEPLKIDRSFYCKDHAKVQKEDVERMYESSLKNAAVLKKEMKRIEEFIAKV